MTHPWGGAWLSSGEGNQSPESSHWSLLWGLPQAPHTLCGADFPQNFNDLSLTFLLSIPFSGSPWSLCFFLAALTPDKGLRRWLSGKESACQCGRCLFRPWMGKIPCRRKWQHTPIFLPEEIPWTEEASGLQSIGSQRYDLVTKQQQLLRQGLASPQHIQIRGYLHDLLRS